MSDALVEGDWTRADLPFATGQGRTDATGTAVITKRLRKPAPGTQIGFCVRNVTHRDLPYQRDFNVETCDEALTP